MSINYERKQNSVTLNLSHTQTHAEQSYLMVCMKPALSLISSGMVLRMRFRARALSLSSWNSGSRLSIMNSANTGKDEEKHRAVHPSVITHMQIITGEDEARVKETLTVYTHNVNEI